MRLDPKSPVPLYHQIAEAIRYDVATGRLAPGTKLPSLRDAAREWGVNLHTVRHAYRTLAEAGSVTIEPPHGAVVAARAHRPRREALERFLERTLREARERHGLAPEQLAALLAGDERAAPLPVAHVVECSRTQCEELARQVEARWEVRAAAWPLDSADRLPDGDVVATYFHYNDVRRLAPKRLEEVRFVTIRPDPALAESVGRFASGRRRAKVALVERDESMARSIAADLSPLLEPLGVELAPLVVPDASDAFGAAGSARAILFSPRMWGALADEQRSDGRALEVRYLIDPSELRELGRGFGWRARSERSAAARGATR